MPDTTLETLDAELQALRHDLMRMEDKIDSLTTTVNRLGLAFGTIALIVAILYALGFIK